MKKTLLFVFAVLFSISAMNAQTVIFEDGFESYEHGYNLVDADYDVWEGTATVTDVTAEGAEGTANSGDKFGKSDANKTNFFFRKTFTLEAGKTYTWEIATKSEDGTKHSLKVYPKETYPISEDFFNVDWQTHSVQFTVEAGFEEVTLAVYRWSQKVVSFDDFKLVEETSTAINGVKDDAVQVTQTASGEFIVTGTNDISSLSVFTTSGQLVKKMANKGASEVTFNLNGQPQGVYILKVEDVQGDVSVKKVVNN